MSELEGIANGTGRFQEVRFLVSLQNEDLSRKSRDELVDIVLALSSDLLAYRDLTVDAESAARFFNRKRSWIYEATSQPRTELQRDLLRVVSKKSGVLIFQLSDLVDLRRRLFDRNT